MQRLAEPLHEDLQGECQGKEAVVDPKMKGHEVNADIDIALIAVCGLKRPCQCCRRWFVLCEASP